MARAFALDMEHAWMATVFVTWAALVANAKSLSIVWVSNFSSNLIVGDGVRWVGALGWLFAVCCHM